MKKIRYILIVCCLLFIIASFTRILPFQYSHVLLFVLLSASMSITAVEEYNRNHDKTAKLSAVLAVFCFVTAVINFFRLF